MFRFSVIIAALAVILTACGDKSGSVTQPPASIPTTVTVTLAGEIRVGVSTPAVAQVLDQRGAVMAGQVITWRSDNDAIARVGPTGIVTGMAPGNATIQATVKTAQGSASIAVLQVPVSSVSLNGPPSMQVGESVQWTATARDSAGNALTGRAFVWASSDTTRARVDAAGMVTAVATGPALITVTAEQRSTSSPLTIVAAGAFDFAIEAAQWTQGVQAGDGTMPMVLNGGAAVVNVALSSTLASARSMQVVLRLFDAGASQYRADTVTATLSSAVASNVDYPSVQFLVPASSIMPGMSWQVVRDPRGVTPDSVSANDVFPREGRAALATIQVPTLKVRFVPIVLAAHNNTTGQVTIASLSAYTQTLRSIHPVGALELSIGAPFTTGATFGVPPSGGDAPFWQSVLAELDLARVTTPGAADEYWIGVVAPPPGFSFTQYGGFGFIPFDGASSGPGTRTNVLVHLGWFSRPSQTRDLVAHELGHNFGRRHAPCAGAGGPDPAFPISNGTIGRAGHDVYSWSSGFAANATTISADVGDVMGYCFPVWSSEYTYKGILNFRGSGLLAQIAQAEVQHQRVLVVRGRVAGTDISLEPALTMENVPAASHDAGDYFVEGLAGDGRVLFSRRFTPATLDHSDDVRPFTVLVPTEDAVMQQLVRVRVRGPAGAAELSASNRSETCTVQDARTHRLLAILPKDAAAGAIANPARSVWCSNGVTGKRTVD